MHQRCKAQHEVTLEAVILLIVDGLTDHCQGVLEHILVVVVFVDLEFQGRQLWQDQRGQTAVNQNLEPEPRVLGLHQLDEFIMDALGRDYLDALGH